MFIFQDPSAHMNLGAMLHLVGKLKEAEDRYFSALKLNPGDSATKTNIQRLHNIMRKKGMKVKSFEQTDNS
jgi:Flp pilus assembly protein TadD